MVVLYCSSNDLLLIVAQILHFDLVTKVLFLVDSVFFY